MGNAGRIKKTLIMKKHILIIAASGMGISTSAQVDANIKDRSRFGVFAGINNSKFTNTEEETFNSKTSFDVGLHWNFRISNKSFMPMEVQYSDFKFESQLRIYHFRRIALNLLYKHYFTNNIFADIGVGVGLYPLSGTNSFKNGIDVRPYKNYLDKAINDAPYFDLPLIVGIGYEFRNRIFFQIRYSIGIFKSWDETLNKFSPLLSDASAPRQLSVSLGYSF
jgi:hypothetical protein